MGTTARSAPQGGNWRGTTHFMTWELRVGAVQMRSTNGLAANLGVVRDLTGRAVSEGARFVAHPECFSFLGQREGDKLAIAESLEPGGTIVATYRKIHLFDVDIPGGAVLRESDATCAGSDLVVADIDGAKVGLTICYDVRFPELYRSLALDRGAGVRG